MPEFEHRGNFQAQSVGYDESEPWAQSVELRALTGHHLLSYLEYKISPKQAALRKKEFRDAHKFIDRIASNGGCGPTSKTFLVRGHGTCRVDVVVHYGWAFS